MMRRLSKKSNFPLIGSEYCEEKYLIT